MLLIHFIFRLCEIFFLSNQRTKNGDFASIILEIFLKFEAEKSKLSDFAFFFFFLLPRYRRLVIQCSAPDH